MARRDIEFDEFSDFILDGGLNSLARYLEHVGLAEFAQQLREARVVAIDLTHAVRAEAAVTLLGFRSTAWVRSLVEHGLLEGEEVGGQLFVTRASVARFAESPGLATQRRLEQEVWSLLGD